MIDFHYSDWWADPGKQNKPEAWKSLDQAGLLAAIDTHTRQVLTALKNAGVTPTWVQAGNETNDGMLWENGRASKNMAAFSAMVNASYKAIKEVFPSAKVIVHISNGYDNSLFRWMFDGLKANNTNYDVIGMSLYPDPNNWFAANEQTNFNMKDMIARYGKEVMICEVGMPVDQADKCRQFIEDLMKRVKNLPDQKGLGVFYWEPQCHNDWKGYKLGAFDNQGRPTVALDAFKN
jgi:arabinogalactan endo-1,4-beta-galactosidase